MADLCYQIPAGSGPSQTQLLAACTAETVSSLLAEWNPDAPPLKTFVRDCDFGDPPCGCDFVTAAATLTKRRQNGAAAKCVTTWDATIELRVARPAGKFCPDGRNDNCAAVSDMDAYLMAEREHIQTHLEGALAKSCGGCCSAIAIASIGKLCGGECGGTKLTVNVSGFLFGQLKP